MDRVRHQWLRLQGVWWGGNVAHLRWLQRTGRVAFGEQTYGEPKVHYFPWDTTRLIAGNFSSVTGNYLLGGEHDVKHVTNYPLRIRLGLPGAGTDGNPQRRGDIVVGSDAWTGYGCWIRSGVTIGDGAVVATGAVVTSDVPPFAIVGGTPAKVISYRHTEEQRRELLAIRWWDWPLDEVRRATPYLADRDVDRFLEYARSR